MMQTRFLVLVPWLCALLAVAPTPAVGQDVPPEKLEQFEQHVASGAKLYKAEKYHQALQEFRQARKIVDHPKLSYKIGRTLEQLNRCAKARSAYERYLDYEDLADADRKAAQKRLDELDNCKPLGRLEVACVPDNARVEIGQQTFDCPAGIDLEAGSYTVGVSADGHPSTRVQVDVEPEQTTKETVDLTQTATPTDWKSYTKWGAVGVGGALFLGGLITDISAISRHDRIADAVERDATARLEELDAEARAAKTRAIVLYTTGALVAGTGVVLFAIDSSPENGSAALLPGRDNDPHRAGLRIGPTHIGAFFRF